MGPKARPILPLLIAALLCLTTLSGCGSGASPATTTVTVTSRASTGAPSAPTGTASSGKLTADASAGQVLYHSNSGAMLPTLPIGGAFVVQPGATLTNGTIIVFHPPSGADEQPPACGNADQGPGHPAPCDAPMTGASAQTFVKRVIGMPGQRLSMRDGAVYRDGVKLNEPYTEPCEVADMCDFSQTITIPPSEYFVLGDNRPDSDDSRFWGPVPAADVIGAVVACQPATPYCTRG